MNVLLWCILMFLTLLCIGLISLVCACCVYLVVIHRRYAHIPGPPIESFFLGNLRKLREIYKRGDYSHILFLEWAQQYGAVYKVIILHKCFIILSSQNLIKEVLTQNKYPKAHMTYSRLYGVCGERFLGNGLITSMDHQTWSERRAAINPAFHKKLLSGMMQPFNEVADKWLDKLEPLADGKTYFNMADYLGRVTLDAIGKVGFDVDFHALGDVDSPFPKALWQILEGYSAQLRDPLFRYYWSRRQFVQRVQRSVQVIRSEGRRLVEKRIEQIQHGENVPDDILTSIAKSKETRPDITVEDMLDEFCTLLIAGQETTANMLAFLLKELGAHPGVYHKMLEEIDTVLGDRTHITYDDISRLEYMGQVIRETLRLYPPAMGTARDSVQDTVLNGYPIPSGTQLVVSFYVIHRLPEYFSDPDDFRPERFKADIPRQLYTFMPFSLGQRSCAGQNFAMIEAKVLLCKFFQKFTFEIKPDQPQGIQETTTLRPKGGVHLSLTLRDLNNGWEKL